MFIHYCYFEYSCILKKMKKNTFSSFFFEHRMTIESHVYTHNDETSRSASAIFHCYRYIATKFMLTMSCNKALSCSIF